MSASAFVRVGLDPAHVRLGLRLASALAPLVSALAFVRVGLCLCLASASAFVHLGLTCIGLGPLLPASASASPDLYFGFLHPNYSHLFSLPPHCFINALSLSFSLKPIGSQRFRRGMEISEGDEGLYLKKILAISGNDYGMERNLMSETEAMEEDLGDARDTVVALGLCPYLRSRFHGCGAQASPPREERHVSRWLCSMGLASGPASGWPLSIF